MTGLMTPSGPFLIGIPMAALLMAAWPAVGPSGRACAQSGTVPAVEAGHGSSRPDHTTTGQTISRQSAARNQRVADENQPDRRIGRQAGHSIWKTMGSLAVVLGLIVVAAMVWKRGPSGRWTMPPEALDVLGRRTIDGKQSVYLLRVGGRILLVGSSAAGLSTLAEITDPVEVDSLAGMCRRDQAAGRPDAGFLALLGRNRWASHGWSDTVGESQADDPAAEGRHASRAQQEAARA